MIKDYIKFPQRKIKKSYRSVTGHFPSVKNNKSIGFESLLEKAHFLYLEFDNSVAAYYEQPQIEIYFKNRYVIYSIDCYVIRSKNSNLKDTIVEVKYVSDLEKHKEYFEQKFEATKIFTNEHNLDFQLFTDESLNQIYLDNLDFLYRYKVNPIENKYEKEIFIVLKEAKKLSAFELAQEITTNPVTYSLVANTIWTLVAQEKLKTDLYREKLTMNSLLEVAS